MKTPHAPARAYINSVPVRHGEVTIVTSTNAFETMRHSSKLAENTMKAGVPALLINCSVSDKYFKEYFSKHHTTHSGGKELILHSSVRGNLIGEREAID